MKLFQSLRARGEDLLKHVLRKEVVRMWTGNGLARDCKRLGPW
jgi:hypothetical protein